jgi:hypothetical protein
MRGIIEKKKFSMNRAVEMTSCQIPSVSSVVKEKSRMKGKRPQMENRRKKGEKINQVFRTHERWGGMRELFNDNLPRRLYSVRHASVSLSVCVCGQVRRDL